MSTSSTKKVRHIRLGILVPSSNTVLEPLSMSILSSILQSSGILITGHFSRFPVTEISLSDKSASQFQLSTIISAARLLADAKVDVIGWSGTSAGWLGFETDEQLCLTIEQELQIPATSSTLALNELLQALGATRLGLVTPYTIEMNHAIQANYSKINVEIPEAGIRGLGMTVNSQIAEIAEQTIAQMVEDVAVHANGNGSTVITTFCTNMRAAQAVKEWEQQFENENFIVLDSVSTVIWGMLKRVNVNPNIVQGWGKMFNVN